ncbi:MAG: acyl carrier protein [Henriciella sp.]|nr:acyl carrier protein [Henriciella sp.]
MQITSDVLLDYFSNELFIDTSDVANDTLLFSSGLIDSFNMINLIMFIEETCQTKVKPPEITLDNLDSIDRILSFLEKRAA